MPATDNLHTSNRSYRVHESSNIANDVLHVQCEIVQNTTARSAVAQFITSAIAIDYTSKCK